MKRKFISFMMAIIYTALCMAGFVPVVTAASVVVEFADDFESAGEQEGIQPTKWDVDTSGTATMAIVKEGDNQYARITRGAGNQYSLPVIATKDNLVNLPLWQLRPIITEARIRTNAFASRKSLRLGYPKGTYEDYGSSKHTLFMLRDAAAPAFYYLNGKTIDTFSKEQTVAAKYTNKTLAPDTWYDIKAVIDPRTRKVTFSFKDDIMTEPIVTEGIMDSEEFKNMSVISNITFKWSTPAAETMDVDNIKLYYGTAAEIQEFADDFESAGEQEGIQPTKWDADTSGTATMAIVKEGDNQYARITRGAGNSTLLPVIATKDNLVNLPLWQLRPIITEARIRTSAFASRKSLRLGYPKVKYEDYGSNKHTLFMLRDAAAPAFYYLNGKAIDASSTEQTVTVKYANKTLAPNTWYDIKAVIDPITRKVSFSIKDDTMTEPLTMEGLISSEEFNIMPSITNITFKWITPAAETMDVDNIKLYYGNEPPEVLSFYDDFQTEEKDTAPSKWDADRKKVATVTVLEEAGNKFARIEKTAAKTGAPIVATKDGVINLPMHRQGQNVIVEARIRPNTPSANRNYLRLSFPKDPNYINNGGNKHALFFTHNVRPAFNFLSNTYGTGATEVPTFFEDTGLMLEAKWYGYRAVIDTDNKKISHYIDGNLILAQQAFTGEEFENLVNITNLTFTWLMTTSSEAASMDFDDVKIYSSDSFFGDIQYTQGTTRLEQLVNGSVTANVYVKNNADAKSIFVATALYEKKNDGYMLKDVKLLSGQQLAEYAAAKYTLDVLQVTDADNQIIKTFVWDDAQTPLVSEAHLDKGGQ